MGKVTGPVPQAVRRRRNKPEGLEPAKGTRRGITINTSPHPDWRTDVKNMYMAALSSAQADFWEDSDVMQLWMYCVFMDRILRQSRLVPVYKTHKNAEGDWVPILDEEGQPIPEMDDWGKPEMQVLGSVNGQALKAVFDQSENLLLTEGARRKLRIDLGVPITEEEDEAAAIVARQRAQVGKVTPITRKKSS